jgi:hypothetical protein
MSLISGSIPNLINGVSQQPPSLRLKTQAEAQENGLSSVVEGLKKRPGTEHIATLSELTGDLEGVFMHTMRLQDADGVTRPYFLVVTDQTVQVFDSEGVAKTITANPETATQYLSGLTDPATQITATTIADFTFIVNKTKKVKQGTETSPERPEEAMFYVKQGDYQTDYKITVNFNGTNYTASKLTKDSANAGNEEDIRTNKIAQDLYNGLSLPSGFTKELLGNILYIKRDDGQPFTISTTDSRGDTFLLGFKGTVADFKDLPEQGKLGFSIRVNGDSTKGEDDYYVTLTQTEANGLFVWKESVQPGLILGFDETTMPHKLVRLANGTFEFGPVDYAKRKAGDDETNPFPSFANYDTDEYPDGRYTINDIFFHRNRMGFLSDENVIMSESGTYFNFFQNTVLTLIDSAPIDVAVSNNQVSILKHGVPFNESLLLFSDLTQFKLSAVDILTPETVSIDVTTQFEASLKAKPVGAGKYVFFPTIRGSYAGVREYFVDKDTETNDAANITAHVPDFIDGEIKTLAASSNEDMLLAHTENDPDSLYVYKFYWSGTEKLQSSWSKWTFSGEIKHADFDKSDIYMIIKRGSDYCLERINLSEDTAEAETSGEFSVHLDRRVRLTEVGDTPPYTDEATVYIVNDGTAITAENVDAYISAGGIVYAGTPFTFRYVFSEQVVKQNNDPITIGRLQIRNFSVVFNGSGYFNTVVRTESRDPVYKEYTGRVIGSTYNRVGEVRLGAGTFRFPVQSNSKTVEVELTSDSYLPCIFQSAEWEGYYKLRSQRI